MSDDMIKEITSNYPGNIAIYNQDYYVFDDGRVFSTVSNKFLTPYFRVRDGHYYISLGKGIAKKLCIIIADCFLIHNKELRVIRHRDGNKANNSILNLQRTDRAGFTKLVK